MRRIPYISIVWLLLITAGCSEESKSGAGKHMPDDTNSTVDVKAGSTRMITLPTPMQIPALLRNTKATYQPVHLLPITQSQKSYYKSGILFGMYMSDLAYACSFSHQQSSLNYFQACRDLAGNLGLGVKITPSHVERFNRNLNKPDSLGYIVLEMYDIGHKVLIDQEKEGLGFLMVMGCYMESLNLIMHQAREHDLILFVHLLNQQKNYAINLEEMLAPYEIPHEISMEYEAFKTVFSTFNAMDIPSVYDLKSGKRTISGLDRDKIEALEEAIVTFRNSILI